MTRYYANPSGHVCRLLIVFFWLLSRTLKMMRNHRVSHSNNPFCSIQIPCSDLQMALFPPPGPYHTHSHLLVPPPLHDRGFTVSFVFLPMLNSVTLLPSEMLCVESQLKGVFKYQEIALFFFHEGLVDVLVQ